MVENILLRFRWDGNEYKCISVVGALFDTFQTWPRGLLPELQIFSLPVIPFYGLDTENLAVRQKASVSCLIEFVRTDLRDMPGGELSLLAYSEKKEKWKEATVDYKWTKQDNYHDWRCFLPQTCLLNRIWSFHVQVKDMKTRDNTHAQTRTWNRYYICIDARIFNFSSVATGKEPVVFKASLLANLNSKSDLSSSQMTTIVQFPLASTHST